MSTETIPEKSATTEAKRPKLKLKAPAVFNFSSFFLWAKKSRANPATNKAGGKWEMKG
jgi:hypothetical protein